MEHLQRNELLRQHRIQHNWRLHDVAEQLGTSVHTVQRWERGTQHPSAYYRAKLCELFGLNSRELGLVETAPLSLVTQSERAAPAEPAWTEPLSLEKETPLWTVPHLRNPHFTGRENLLEQIERCLTVSVPAKQTDHSPQPPTARNQTKIYALKGLGGIGKTQIAIEYVYRSYEEKRYTHIFWVAAASNETILTSFTAIADLLPGLSIKHESDQSRLLGNVLHWLEQCPSPWLLIFDNADDLSLLQGYLPRQGHGYILLTTRANAVGSLGTPIEVDNMNLADGTCFLLRRAQRLHSASESEVEEARQIVAALAQFPLALDQAGAYIEETGCGFSTYLRLFQNHRQTLLARRGSQATNYPDSVATTWALSFQQINQIDLATVQLLRLCSFLAPDRIPEELLTEGAPFWPEELRQAVTDPLSFNQLVQHLLTFSLVKRLTTDQALSIHRLVQVVYMDQLDSHEQRSCAEMVVRAVHALFPADPRDSENWPQCLRYLEQVEACEVLITRYDLWFPEAAELLERVGIYHREHSSHRTAEPALLQALQIREHLLGKQHLVIARSLNSLAVLYWRWGKYRQAEPLFQQALSIREQQLGPDHFDTAQSQHNLALIHLSMHHYPPAETLFQQAYAFASQRLGPTHEKTLITLHNLALVQQLQGKLAQTKVIYWQTLIRWELRTRSGEISPLSTFDNGVAELLAIHDQTAQLELLAQRTLTLGQTYGTRYTTLHFFLGGVANFLYLSGQLDQAELLYKCKFDALQHFVGLEHDYTLDMLQELALVYREQGKYGLAASLFRQVLSAYQSKYTFAHPEIAEVQHNFAMLWQQQGYIEEARPLYEQALHAREEIFGPDHPRTRETSARLSQLIESIKLVEEAETL